MCCIDVVLLCSGVIAGSTALGNFCGASCSQVSIGLNRNHLAISKRNCYETILTGSNDIAATNKRSVVRRGSVQAGMALVKDNAANGEVWLLCPAG